MKPLRTLRETISTASGFVAGGAPGGRALPGCGIRVLGGAPGGRALPGCGIRVWGGAPGGRALPLQRMGRG